MSDDYYDYEDEALPRKKDSLFLWTILILLLIGAAFACWLGSFYIFGHPEEARSYAVLKKLKKIEAPRRFDVTAAPQGEFLNPQKAFERYSTLTPLELKRENAELLRIYIKNYTETKKLVPYMRGKFDVMESGELTAANLFTSGTVALMQASDYAQVVVEHLFPATGSNVETSKRLLSPGYPFNIEKTNDVTAIIHVERLADGRMLFTVVPLHYPSYALKGGAGTFASEPPLDLNVAAGLPVTGDAKMNQALKRYAQLRAQEPVVDDPTITGKPPEKGPELVRADIPMGQVVPETGALPEPPVAKAIPVSPLQPTPRPRTDLAMNRPTHGVATPIPIGQTVSPTLAPTPRPVPLAVHPATPPPVPATPPAVMPPTPAPTPPLVAGTTPGGVPLKPFVQSNAGVAPPSEAGGTWRLYSAGTQPRGRIISSTEALNLVDQAGAGERLYLSGSFVVTAKGDNKAVLRPKGEALPPGSSIRIIAEFPNGALPPSEGDIFARDSARGFEVRQISRADDGQTINVFVREVTRGQ